MQNINCAMIEFTVNKGNCIVTYLLIVSVMKTLLAARMIATFCKGLCFHVSVNK